MTYDACEILMAGAAWTAIAILAAFGALALAEGARTLRLTGFRVRKTGSRRQ